VAPGAVHLPDWLDGDEQRRLVEACGSGVGRARRRARDAGHPAASGGVMSVRTVCLGWHWRPYRYSRTVDDGDGGPVLPFPRWLAELGRRAVAEAYRDRAAGAAYEPDIALVNYYDEQAKMGLPPGQGRAQPGPGGVR